MGAVGSRGATMHRNHLQACTILKKGTRENDGETSHHQVKLQPFISTYYRILHTLYMYIYIYMCVCVSHEATHFTSFILPTQAWPACCERSQDMALFQRALGNPWHGKMCRI